MTDRQLTTSPLGSAIIAQIAREEAAIQRFMRERDLADVRLQECRHSLKRLKAKLKGTKP